MRRLDSSMSHGSAYSEEVDGVVGSFPAGDMNGKLGRISQHLEPEYNKLVLSYLYMFSVFMMTSFVMVSLNHIPNDSTTISWLTK